MSQQSIADTLRDIARGYDGSMHPDIVVAALYSLLTRAADRLDELEPSAHATDENDKPAVDRSPSGITQELAAVANHPPAHPVEAALSAIVARAKQAVERLETDILRQQE